MKHLIGIVLVILAFLTSCGQTDNKYSQDTSQSQIEQKEIKWLAQWYGYGKQELIIHEIARDFSFLNQDYYLTIEFPHQIHGIAPEASNYYQNIDTITKMVTQNKWPYDIMLCDIYLYSAVAQAIGDPNWAQKYLVDFKDEKWYQNSHKEVIYTTDKYSKQYGGIAPGAYIEAFWDLLYMSDVAEKKLDIKVKRTDMTMDDFTGYAKAVYEYNKGHEEKITFFLEQREDDGYNSMMTHWVMSWLEKEQVDSLEEAYIALQNVYSKLEEASKYLPAEQHYTPKDEWDLQPDKALFVFHSSWVFTIWERNSVENASHMHLCEFPTASGKVAPAYPGNYNPVFAIPKAAKNKEGAIKLMKQISTVEVGERWTKYAKGQTGLRNRITYGDFDKSEISAFSRFIAEKYNNLLVTYNLSNVLFGNNFSINFHGPAVLRGEITAEEALVSVKKQVEELK